MKIEVRERDVREVRDDDSNAVSIISNEDGTVAMSGPAMAIAEVCVSVLRVLMGEHEAMPGIIAEMLLDVFAGEVPVYDISGNGFSQRR